MFLVSRFLPALTRQQANLFLLLITGIFLLFLFLSFCLRSFVLGKNVPAHEPRTKMSAYGGHPAFVATIKLLPVKLTGKLPGKVLGLKIAGDSRNTRKIIGYFPGHLPVSYRDCRDTAPWARLAGMATNRFCP